jgi:hypothetical protein
MKIRRILAYRVELPVKEGSYKWSGGKSVEVFDSTVVRIETDTGLAGHGEVCPLGPAYLPSYAAGVRTGLAELAPHLLGHDPRQIGPLNRVMEARLKGHPYVKSAIDMALWDVLGLATGQPVAGAVVQCLGQLECHVTLDHAVRALGQPHGTHAAGAEHTQQPIRPDLRSGLFVDARCGVAGCRLAERPGSHGVTGFHRLCCARLRQQLLQHRRKVAIRLRQRGDPFVSVFGIDVERLRQQAIQALPIAGRKLGP